MITIHWKQILPDLFFDSFIRFFSQTTNKPNKEQNSKAIIKIGELSKVIQYIKQFSRIGTKGEIYMKFMGDN